MAVVVYWEEKGVVFPTVCLPGTVVAWLNQGIQIRTHLMPKDRYRLQIAPTVYQQLQHYCASSSYQSLPACMVTFSQFLSGVGGQLLSIQGPDKTCLYQYKSAWWSVFQNQVLGGILVLFLGLFGWGLWLDDHLSRQVASFEDRLHDLTDAIPLPEVSPFPVADLTVLIETLHDWPVAVDRVSVTTQSFQVLGRISRSDLWSLRQSISDWESISDLKSHSQFRVVSEDLLHWEFLVQL